MTTRKTTRAAGNAKISVKVGRFGEPTSEFKICKGTCVKSVLSDLNISAGDGQLYINGAKAFDDTILVNGDTIQIIGKKQGGSEEAEEATNIDTTEDDEETTD